MSTELSVQRLQGLFSEGKSTGSSFDDSTLSSAAVKNEWSYRPTHPTPIHAVDWGNILPHFALVSLCHDWGLCFFSSFLGAYYEMCQDCSFHILS